MGQYFPYGRFNWLSLVEINRFDLNLIKKNSINGCILQKDLKHPDKLHNLHNDSPLAPAQLEIKRYMVIWCQNIVMVLQKLIALKSVVLKLYLSLRRKLVKTYKILKFKQSDLLKNTLILTQIRERKQLIFLKNISSS